MMSAVGGTWQACPCSTCSHAVKPPSWGMLVYRPTTSISKRTPGGAVARIQFWKGNPSWRRVCMMVVQRRMALSAGPQTRLFALWGIGWNSQLVSLVDCRGSCGFGAKCRNVPLLPLSPPGPALLKMQQLFHHFSCNTTRTYLTNNCEHECGPIVPVGVDPTGTFGLRLASMATFDAYGQITKATWP